MIDTYYELREVTATGTLPRLYFDNTLSSFIRRPIAYNQPNQPVTENIIVYVKVCTCIINLFND